MTTAGDFIGRGWAYPVRVSPRGGVALAREIDELEGALRLILGTAPGERLMRPEFGCAIWDQIFSPVDANALGLMAQAVRDAVARWEPRIELEDVTTSQQPDDAAAVRIDISYRVKATNDRRNLVYPFYTIPRESEER